MVDLDLRLEKKLAAYTLAAGAAGVGLFAGVPQAEGKVVYTNTWITISPTTGVPNIDLNNDGIVDFLISVEPACTTDSGHLCKVMKVLPLNHGNAVWGAGTYASALKSGVTLGSHGQFKAGHEFMEESFFGETSWGSTFSGSKGQWGQTTNRFLGVKFEISGEVHYGWVRLDISPTFVGMYGAISGYAYESEPNKPIKTGQKSGQLKKTSHGKQGHSAANVAPSPTGNLGQLALGALGLKSWGKANGPRPVPNARRGELS
jgi:hypothetical protein